jgi:hypothetical protein
VKRPTVITDKTDGITFVGFVGSFMKRYPRARRHFDGEIIRSSTLQTGEHGAWEGSWRLVQTNSSDLRFRYQSAALATRRPRIRPGLQRRAREPGHIDDQGDEFGDEDQN